MNGGVVCNSELSIASGIYAAGDDVSYYHEYLGRRRSRCHEHDVASGRVAAENMVDHVVSRQGRQQDYVSLG